MTNQDKDEMLTILKSATSDQIMAWASRALIQGDVALSDALADYARHRKQ